MTVALTPQQLHDMRNELLAIQQQIAALRDADRAAMLAILETGSSANYVIENGYDALKVVSEAVVDPDQPQRDEVLGRVQDAMLDAAVDVARSHGWRP